MTIGNSSEGSKYIQEKTIKEDERETNVTKLGGNLPIVERVYCLPGTESSKIRIKKKINKQKLF